MSALYAKIDCTKIVNEHLFHGKKGQKYLDLVFLENKDGEDDYGNTHFIVQGVTKEKREAGIKGPILGNANLSGQKKQRYQTDTNGRRQGNPEPTQDDVPF